MSEKDLKALSEVKRGEAVWTAAEVNAAAQAGLDCIENLEDVIVELAGKNTTLRTRKGRIVRDRAVALLPEGKRPRK